ARLETDGDVLRIDVRTIERHREVRTPEDVDERQRPRAAPPFDARAGVGPRGAQPFEELGVRKHTALVEDGVADEGHPAVAREEKPARVRLEISRARVVLNEGREPRLAEDLASERGSLGELAPYGDAERRLVPEDAGVGGAVKRGGRVARSTAGGAF